jgi:hypothetical protein
MIQVYADGSLIYDSRIDELALTELTATLGLNKSGVATLTLSKDHPAHDAFTSYRTVVEIYRDGSLRFRGRALYPSDDFDLNRTITCEGERGFFRDGVMRPYLYQEPPADIFRQVIGLYNAQVEAFKQFDIGTVDVTDPNDYVRVESEDAESFAATLDKLVEMCGGYITFTTNGDGKRTVNWVAQISTRSAQVIEYGGNLLDFARTDANTELATVIVPYGAKNAAGKRVTVESVNGGLDFIQDSRAVALRGFIAQAVYWDDVTTPDALLSKAQQYLETSSSIVTSLELTAVDLSLLDKTIDSFRLGDTIQVRSTPHRVDDEYQLEELNIDFLHPDRNTVVLGKSRASLTGSDVAGDRKSASDLQKVERHIKQEYQLNQMSVLEEARALFTSLLQQTSESLMLEVAEQYVTNGTVESAIKTTMRQLSDSFEFLFSQLETRVDANDADSRAQFEQIEKYIRFESGNIILGEQGNEITLRIENDRICFLDAGAEVAYFSNQRLTVLDGSFLHSLSVGSFRFIPRENGNLSLVKVGD